MLLARIPRHLTVEDVNHHLCGMHALSAKVGQGLNPKALNAACPNMLPRSHDGDDDDDDDDDHDDLARRSSPRPPSPSVVAVFLFMASDFCHGSSCCLHAFLDT